jgi:hypothetical protein
MCKGCGKWIQNLHDDDHINCLGHEGKDGFLWNWIKKKIMRLCAGLEQGSVADANYDVIGLLELYIISRTWENLKFFIAVKKGLFYINL